MSVLDVRNSNTPAALLLDLNFNSLHFRSNSIFIPGKVCTDLHEFNHAQKASLNSHSLKWSRDLSP